VTPTQELVVASIGARTNADGEVRYRVQARVDGKPQQKTFLHIEGAKDFASRVEKIGWDAAVKVLEARQRIHTTPSLKDWTELYLDAASGMLTGIEEGTREDYKRAAERSFLQILGDMPVDAITKADVGRWVSWQEKQLSQGRKQPVSQKTVQNYHSILSAALRAAVEHKLRDDNPAWKTRITRGEKREGVFLTPEEFSTILYFTPDRYVGFLMFLAGTGCRWGEATALTWGKLNLTGTPPTVRIDKAWKRAPRGQKVLKQPKSKKSNRTVSLTPDVIAALGEPGPADELVFPSRTGKAMMHSSFRSNVWLPLMARAHDEKLCEEAGVEVLRKNPNPHDLRHSHASWLIAAGVPLPFVQARLGHENITTTVGTYGHLQPDAHMQMADAIGSTLSGVRRLKQVTE
jgi:integrase